MLSSIGRAALKRGGAGARAYHVSTNRVAQRAGLLQLTDSSQPTYNFPGQYQLAIRSRRCYATATNVATKPAAKTTKPKSTAGKTKAKKPAAKVAKKKKPVKKAAKKPAKKPKKKVLTEEQQKAAVIKSLKAKALSPPPTKPNTVWQCIFQDTMRTEVRQEGVGNAAKDAAAKYKSLSPAEIESYNHQVNQNQAANQAALKKWIESHTPDEIRIANNARTMLKRKLNKPASYTLISDPRIPKKPANSYLHYVQEKLASGDFKGIKLSEAIVLISNEWKALSPSQKTPYEDLARADMERYHKEFKSVFHREPSEAAPRQATS